MGKYAARRLLEVIPTLLIVSVVVFGLIRLAPGDPAAMKMGREAARPENKPRLEALRREMGLDQPIPVQYALWLRDVVTGDFGVSTRSDRPVAQLIADRLPATLQLVVGAMLFAMVVGFPAGLLAGLRRGTWIDKLTMGFVTAGLAVPSFWLGLTLILVISVQLRWLPPSGHVPFFTDPGDNLRRMIMPAATLGIYLSATLMRFLRADMIEVMAADYVRTARAKGLPESRVVFGHALKNGLIPVLTITGLELGALLGGAVIIEQVFGWSGLGWLTVQAIADRDYPVVQAAVLLIALGLTLVNLLVDLSYGLLNPKIRAQYGS